MYCKFETTGDVFKNKKIYKCENCNLTLALEDPDAKITCFSYHKTVFNQELDGHIASGKPFNIKSQDEIDAIAQKVIENNNNFTNYSPPPNEAPPEETLCTDEQISDRLAVCNRCEYYENDACTLCGCHIVREKNYMNKLAKKESMCPDGRWGPVN